MEINKKIVIFSISIFLLLLILILWYVKFFSWKKIEEKREKISKILEERKRKVENLTWKQVKSEVNKIAEQISLENIKLNKNNNERIDIKTLKNNYADVFKKSYKFYKKEKDMWNIKNEFFSKKYKKINIQIDEKTNLVKINYNIYKFYLNKKKYKILNNCFKKDELSYYYDWNFANCLASSDPDLFADYLIQSFKNK